MKRQKKSADTVEVADTNLESRDIPLQEPVPMPNDPGGAHAKGYSPDAGPDMQADVDTEGPIPLTDTPEKPHVCRPEHRDKIRTTGRTEPRAYSPNDRLMGSDR